MEDKKSGKKKKIKIANLIFWIVLGIVAIYAVVALTATDDGAMSIFGQAAYTVQTPSMSGTFEKGDLIYVDTNFDLNDIVPNENVITYRTLIDVNGDGTAEWVYNSHRVINVVEGVNGHLYFYTQGDANPDPDEGYVLDDYVVGVWTGKVTSNIGGIIDAIIGFVKSSLGFFIFIVLPCFAFLIYEVIRFIGVMTEYKTQQALSDRVKIQEEALALARAQLEAEGKLKQSTTEE